jgi:hypothetical protein
MIIKTTIMKADEPTINGNIYPRSVLEKAIAEYQGVIDQERSFGTCEEEASSTSIIEIAKVSHMVRKLDIDKDQNVNAEIEILQTGEGNRLKAFIESGGKIHFGLSGFGSVTDGVVGKDFILKSIGIDIDNSIHNPNQTMDILDD